MRLLLRLKNGRLYRPLQRAVTKAALKGAGKSISKLRSTKIGQELEAKSLKVLRQAIQDSTVLKCVFSKTNLVASTSEVTKATASKRSGTVVSGSTATIKTEKRIQGTALPKKFKRPYTTGADKGKSTPKAKALKELAEQGKLVITKPGKQGKIAAKKTIFLQNPKVIKHHIFSKFRGNSPKSEHYRLFFKKHGIDVDSHCVELTSDFHIQKIHKAGHNWTTRWKSFIDNNPNISTKDIYQFAGRMMDEYGINHVPLTRYRGL